MASQDGDHHTEEAVNGEQRLKDRKVSWANLTRVDSLNLEAGKVSSAGAKHRTEVYRNYKFILRLFQFT